MAIPAALNQGLATGALIVALSVVQGPSAAAAPALPMDPVPETEVTETALNLARGVLESHRRFMQAQAAIYYVALHRLHAAGVIDPPQVDRCVQALQALQLGLNLFERAIHERNGMDLAEACGLLRAATEHLELSVDSLVAVTREALPASQ